jgi:hypothetical protein
MKFGIILYVYGVRDHNLQYIQGVRDHTTHPWSLGSYYSTDHAIHPVEFGIMLYLSMEFGIILYIHGV